MINISNLLFRYDKKPVIDIAEASFGTNMVHGIVGLNGAGKTTFFNLLAHYLKADQGQIRYNDRPLARQDIAYLETSNFFYSNITGAEYLKIFPVTNKSFQLEKLNELFQLPLPEIAESYSTGMKKKLALLAILQQDKPIYILDEPFNGLDMETNRILEMILENLKQKGKTIFISSHILSPLLTGCDEIHILQKGRFQKSFSKPQFIHIEQELFDDFNKRAGDIVNSSF